MSVNIKMNSYKTFDGNDFVLMIFDITDNPSLDSKAYYIVNIMRIKNLDILECFQMNQLLLLGLIQSLQ